VKSHTGYGHFLGMHLAARQSHLPVANWGPQTLTLGNPTGPYQNDSGIMPSCKLKSYAE